MNALDIKDVVIAMSLNGSLPDYRDLVPIGTFTPTTVPTSPGDPLFSKWGPDGDPIFSEMGT